MSKRYPEFLLNVEFGLMKSMNRESKVDFISKEIESYVEALFDFADENNVPLEGVLKIHGILLNDA